MILWYTEYSSVLHKKFKKSLLPKFKVLLLTQRRSLKRLSEVSSYNWQSESSLKPFYHNALRCTHKFNHNALHSVFLLKCFLMGSNIYTSVRNFLTTPLASWNANSTEDWLFHVLPKVSLIYKLISFIRKK